MENKESHTYYYQITSDVLNKIVQTTDQLLFLINQNNLRLYINLRKIKGHKVIFKYKNSFTIYKENSHSINVDKTLLLSMQHAVSNEISEITHNGFLAMSDQNIINSRKIIDDLINGNGKFCFYRKNCDSDNDSFIDTDNIISIDDLYLRNDDYIRLKEILNLTNVAGDSSEILAKSYPLIQSNDSNKHIPSANTTPSAQPNVLKKKGTPRCSLLLDYVIHYVKQGKTCAEFIAYMESKFYIDKGSFVASQNNTDNEYPTVRRVYLKLTHTKGGNKKYDIYYQPLIKNKDTNLLGKSHHKSHRTLREYFKYVRAP